MKTVLGRRYQNFNYQPKQEDITWWLEKLKEMEDEVSKSYSQSKLKEVEDEVRVLQVKLKDFVENSLYSLYELVSSLLESA